MKNTLGDLNNYLFSSLERLDNEDLSNEELEKEISRSRAITNVASSIIANGALVLKAKIQYEENMRASNQSMPSMLEGG